MLLLVTGAGGFVRGYVGGMADEDHERRCADVARGKAVVAAVDSLVATGTTCPAHETQERTHAIGDDGQREKWNIHVDPTDCSYTLREFTVPGWPIGASARLEYDSRSKIWKIANEGERSTMICP
jgi:hypothetical protein